MIQIYEQTFQQALTQIKDKKKVSRSGWNGKNMYIFLVPGGVKDGVIWRSYVAMKTVDDEIVPWVCSQSDMLCDDWGLVSYF